MKNLLVVILAFYLFVSSIIFVMGTVESNQPKWLSNCIHISRLDYIFPAFEFGCWINKELPN